MGTTDASGWLWLVIDMVMVVVLALGMVYGMAEWQRRRPGGSVDELSQRKTRELYERESRDERAADERERRADRAA